MSLKHLLFIGAYALASTNAAVNFYGSERPDGDYVTCEVPDVSDDEVSAALGMLYFPSEIVPGSNDLQFNETLICGDLASLTVEFVCYDFGGDSTCVPTHDNTDTDADTDADSDADAGVDADSDTDESNTDAVSRRSLAHLEKRAGAACNEWSSECRNQYQSTTGGCASGYQKELYEVQGFSADVWCTKACTDEEEKVCQDQKCPKSKQDCDKYGSFNACIEALTKCAGSPVTMSEDYCKVKYFSPYFENLCRDKGHACVTYQNGACTLNATDYREFVDEVNNLLLSSL
jgi:hypothetical protein